MRKLFFGAALLPIAFVGCSTIISAAPSAARDAKAATFSERFAPALRLNALIAVMNLIWRRLAYMILAGMRAKLVRPMTKKTGVTGGSFFHFDRINRPYDAAS